MNIKNVYRAIDYIENNLKSNLSVENIADYAGYSIYYFSRIFNKTTGHSPYDYIIRRKLSDAANELINTDKKIIDIAFEYQFKNPETFTRAFDKMFNCLPSHIRTLNNLDKLILKEAITKEYLNYITNSMLDIKTEIVNEGITYFIGLVTNDNHPNGPQTSIINHNNDPKKYKEKYIIHFNPVNYKNKTKMIAYKAHSLEDTPSIYVGKKIPGHKYSKFTLTTNQLNMKYIFQYLYQTKLKFTQINFNSPYAIEKINKNADDSDKITITLFIPLD